MARKLGGATPLSEIVLRAQHLLGGAGADVRALQELMPAQVRGHLSLLTTIGAARPTAAETAGVQDHAELLGLVSSPGPNPLSWVLPAARLGSQPAVFGAILRVLDPRPNAREFRK